MTLPPDLPGQPGQPTPGEQSPQPSYDVTAEGVAAGQVADPAVQFVVSPEPDARPAGRSRKGLVAGAAAAVVVLGGAGAWAYAALDGGGAQPEAALPSSAFVYVDVDLDPSAAQKVNLLRLANRFPGLAETLGTDLDESTDLKQLIAETVTRSGECEVDYATDVKPWIGNRAAVAVLPGDDEPTVAFVVAVKDEAAARTAIESGLDCGEGVASTQVAFTEGFAVVTTEGVSAADIVADAAKASLADDEAFSADMKALGDTGLVSFWVDSQAAQTLSDSAAALAGVAPDADMLSQLAGYQTMAGALRANSDSIELASVVAVGEGALASLGSGGGTAVAELPDTTLFAGAAAVDPAVIDTLWGQVPVILAAAGEDPAAFDDGIALLGEQYDIHLPADLKTLLGEQVVLAVDADGLDDVAAIAGLTDLNVGLRTVGDTAALQDLAGRVNALVTMAGVGPLATAETGDGLAIATNDDYARALTGGGDLGSSGAFRSVIDDEASSLMFLDLDRLSTVLEGYMPNDDVLQYLEPVRALGVTQSVEGDHAIGTLRLSFN